MKAKYIIGLILLGGLITWLVWPKERENKYETEVVQRQDVEQVVSVTGTVKARKIIPLRTKKPGQIQILNVKVGDPVKKGDLLLAVDQSNFEIQIQQAEARLAIARANLDQRLAGASNEDISVSAKAVQNAEANLNAALTRLENLKKTSTIEEEKASLDIQIAETKLKDSTTQFQNTNNTNETKLQIAKTNVVSSYENAKNPLNLALVYGKKLASKAEDLLNTNSNKRGFRSYYFGNSLLENTAKNNYILLTEQIDPLQKSYAELSLPTDSENITPMLEKSEALLQNAQTLSQNLYDLVNNTQTTSNASRTTLSTELSELSTLQTNLANTLATLKQSQQSIQNALLNLESTQKTLKTTRDTSRETFNNSRALFDQSQKTLELLQINNQKAIEAAESEVEIARTQLAQARANYNLKSATPRNVDIAALEAQIKAEEASLALAKQQLRDAQIVAPIDGVITSVNVEPGENVTTTQDLIRIMDDELYIVANVSETDIAKVALQQEIDMTFDALSLNDVFEGSVQKIDPAETVVQGVIYYQIEANFENDGRIKSGMTANLDILTGEAKNVIAVSPQAVLYEDNKPFIRILKNKKDVEKRPVKLGLQGDLVIEITDGIQEGEEIILFEKN